MVEMTKKERLEHTRSILNAIPIVRLYDEMGKAKQKENKERKINYELRYLTLKRKYNNITKKLDHVRNCKSELKNKSDTEIIEYIIGVTESEGFP